MASKSGLAIRLRFHNHASKEAAIELSFHQQAAGELRGNVLCGEGQESFREGRRESCFGYRVLGRGMGKRLLRGLDYAGLA